MKLLLVYLILLICSAFAYWHLQNRSLDCEQEGLKEDSIETLSELEARTEALEESVCLLTACSAT